MLNYNHSLDKEHKTKRINKMKITLKNVRLSFPSLFTRSVYEGVEGKYEATFLIPKSDTETVTKIKLAIKSAINEQFKGKDVKIPSHKSCFQDGDEKDYDGYADHWSFKAGNKRRPTIINRDKTPIIESDEIIYPGCYVNASVDIWIQDNNYGKRINANLYGVQFVKDGENFGSGDLDATDDFDEISDFEDVQKDDDFEDVPF